MNRFLIVAAVLSAVTIAFPHVGTCAERALSAEESKLLAKLDNDTIEEVTSLAGEIEQWRTRLADATKQLDDLKRFRSGEGPLIDLARHIAEEATKLKPRLRETFKQLDEIAKTLQEMDALLRQAEFDAENSLGQSEEEFRDELREFVCSSAESLILTHLNASLFEAFQKLRNPAEYARQFLKGQFEAWISQPQEHEILKGLKFTIKRPEGKASVFDPEGGLVAVLEYSALSGAKVEAKGLYFEYDPDKPVPRPNLDRLQVQSDWKSLLPLGSLNSLGGLTVDLGLGFSLSEIEPPIFDKPDENGRRGGIKFKTGIKLADGLPSISGKGVVYPADGTVVWLPPGIQATVNADPPVPIGTTGAAMHGYTIEFLPVPHKEQVTVRTKISTAAPGSARALHLDAGLTIPIPVNFIRIDGAIRMGQGSIQVGDVSGEFNFKAGKVEGDFRIPGKGGLAIGQFYSQEGHFSLTGDGLRSTSKAKLFGQTIDEMDLHIDSSGQGSITARQGINLPGLQFNAPLSAGFEPGFQRVWAKANGQIKGVDLGYFNLVDVALEINADSARKPAPIQIVARTWRASASVELNSLADFNYEDLLKSLREQCLDIYNIASEELAKLEGDARNAAAKAEEDLRHDVSKNAERFGVDRLSTNNKQVDESLGKLSEEGKKAGAKLAKEREDVGEMATKLRENPGEGLQSLVDKVASAPSAWGLGKLVPGGGGGVLGGLLGGGGGGGGSSGPSRAEIETQVRKARTFQLTDELCAAIDQMGRSGVELKRFETIHSASGRQYRDRSGLSVQFRNAQSAPADGEDVALAVLVPVAGFTDRVTPGRPDVLDTGSDVKPVTVRFKGLLGDEKSHPPKARIRVASMSHGSVFPAERIAHREVQRLIERYLPQVDVEGPKEYSECQLAVRNQCDEPIKVWVQTEWRTVRDRQFVWEWSPAPLGSDTAYRFQVQPGATELLKIGARYPAPAGSDSPPVDAEERPLTARRVRLWAESESGERWAAYQSRDLWLLDKDPQLGESRGYFADQIRTYVHSVEPQAGSRIYSERLIRMINKTNEPLSVRMRYRAHEEGRTMWRSLKPFEIPAGAKGFVTSDQGMKLRASQIQFSAQGKHIYFGQYDRKTLDMVEATDGRRLYFAEKIGLFEHVFENPAAQAGQEPK
jgi:hypothetical protein